MLNAADNMRDVGKLADLRTSRGLTQRDVSKALDCAERLVSRWETGEGRPSDENIIALAALYGVRPGYVFEAAIADQQA